MDKVYDHKKVEDKIYQQWDEKGYFKPEVHPDGKPYCIVLPPPNANGALHFGHAMFTVEDILIRYHRMLGDAALWLPGTDHAGIETQFVFEKELAKSGKSRFDFSRDELYGLIKDYVDSNRGGIQQQLKKLGYSLDWSREKFTLDPDIVELVKQTFRKMYEEGLVYRDYRLVSYCTKDGTSFSDLEVNFEERPNPLYYIKYGPLELATTRPETKFGDTAVAVHPSDSRYKEFIGKEIEIETVLGKAKIKVIADETVDPNFGTGVVKITPAHDFADFDMGRRHNLPMKQVIGFDGKMNHYAGEFEGLYVKQARAAVVEKMKQMGLLVRVDENYVSRIGVCYKCKTVLEPLPLEQWYVNVQDIKKKAVDVVKEKKLSIVPKNFEHPYFQWLENLRDWNISRQNVWGIQIPVWYEVHDEELFTVSFIDSKNNHHQGSLKDILSQRYTMEEIFKGLQRVIAPISAKVVFADQKEKDKRYLPETDTFDTWFSSGQWPIVTLKTAKPGDFEKFYPTAVLETAYDILKAWVSRMVMFGLYLTDDVPFTVALFHGIVNDPLGKKMSKSKGNVVNPLEIVEQYGADAVRFALVYGNATGADQSLSYTKLDAARKFTNKLWNMARFLEMKKPEGMGNMQAVSLHELASLAKNQIDKDMVEETKRFVREITTYLEKYQFNLAAERLYEFAWHIVADKYIEEVKNRTDENSYTVLATIYLIVLQLLHPFMPFVTEEIYSQMKVSQTPLIVTPWPKA